MIFHFRMFMIFGLIQCLGFSHMAAVQPVEKDCVICGHACCCPEICAPQLDALRKKENCNQGASICKIPGKSQELFNASQSELIFRPLLAEINSQGLSGLDFPNHLIWNIYYFSSYLSSDVWTPPPRPIL